MKGKGKIAAIIYGPPGSGKSTQAELLSKELGIFHFDTGDFFRKVLYSFDAENLKKLGISGQELLKERKLNESGNLNTPEWVLKVVSKKVKEFSKLDQSILLSGSPRTFLEAFGQNKDSGLMKILSEEYGKKNISIFVLKISETESVRRNLSRIVCSVCKNSFLAKVGSSCPICGGKVEHRKDDKKETMITRLKEYHSRTEPIFTELKKRGYKINFIDGVPAPYKVHQQILNFFK